MSWKAKGLLLLLLLSLLLLSLLSSSRMTAAVAGSSQQPATLAAQLRLIACAIKSMEFGSAGTAHAGTAHLKHCLSVKTCVFQAFVSLAF